MTHRIRHRLGLHRDGRRLRCAPGIWVCRLSDPKRERVVSTDDLIKTIGKGSVSDAALTTARTPSGRGERLRARTMRPRAPVLHRTSPPSSCCRSRRCLTIRAGALRGGIVEEMTTGLSVIKSRFVIAHNTPSTPQFERKEAVRLLRLASTGHVGDACINFGFFSRRCQADNEMVIMRSVLKPVHVSGELQRLDRQDC